MSRSILGHLRVSRAGLGHRVEIEEPGMGKLSADQGFACLIFTMDGEEDSGQVTRGQGSGIGGMNLESDPVCSCTRLRAQRRKQVSI